MRARAVRRPASKRPARSFLAAVALDHLQEASLDFDGGRRAAADQAFGLHFPGIRARIALAMLARIEHAEIEALLIFHGGRAIRIEQIAFVEHGVRRFFPRASAFMSFTASSASASIFSMVCSQLGMPWRILYSCKLFENIAAQAEPRDVRIIRSIMSCQVLSGKRNRVSLSQEIGATRSDPSASCIKDRAAEHQAERNVAVVESVEIFCGGDIEIESAGHLHADRRAAGELRDDSARVGPQQTAQRLAPALRLAEKIAKVFLILPLYFRRATSIWIWQRRTTVCIVSCGSAFFTCISNAIEGVAAIRDRFGTSRP